MRPYPAQDALFSLRALFLMSFYKSPHSRYGMTPSFHWVTTVSGMMRFCCGLDVAQSLFHGYRTPQTGENLRYLGDTPVGAVCDVPIEAHGKLVKRDWYRTRRGTLTGVADDGTTCVLEFDNMHMACMMNGKCHNK